MNPTIPGAVALWAMLGAALPRPSRAQEWLPPADRQLARDILRELIEINTTDSAGHTPEAARAMAQRLRAAGFPATEIGRAHV